MPAKASLLDFERPLTTVDVVIFTVLHERLQVLLVRRPDTPEEPFRNWWALPGGFVDVSEDETLEACAARKLLEKTGIDSPYLEQLGSWGSRLRDPRGWSSTHVYFALIPGRDLRLQSGGNAADARWDDVDQTALRRRLAFDHREILRAAVARLRGKVEYTSLPAYLLAEPFSLPQLQRVYEIVLGRPVDKSGFRTRALAADFLEEAGYQEGASRREAMGYRLKDRSQVVYFPRTFSPRG